MVAWPFIGFRSHGRRGALAVLLLVLAPSGCAADHPLPDRVLDAHVHAAFDGAESAGGTYSAAEMERAFAAANVTGAVVMLPRGSAGTRDVPVPSRQCAGIGPEPDVSGVAAALEADAVACIKIYLGYVHRAPDDAAYAPIYDLAARHGVPVVFHTGDTSTSDAKLKYAHPLALDELAVDRRDMTIVIAHCGNPWIETAAEIAYKNPNVYIECSALMTGDMDELDPEHLERYVTDAIRYVWGYIEDPSKLMFGSDWPLVDIESYVRAYAAAIPPEHHPAVFHDNAARVFGF
ncbi:MAG: amidohydrolase family protein [Gemmatimonadetes bacterium]|nr:amidohydrolase family protein [Gemmatimonadota bacterium]